MVNPDSYTTRVGKRIIRFRAQGQPLPVGPWMRVRARDTLLCEQGR